MPGAGAWIRPYRDGFRVYYRREPGGVLGGSRVLPTVAAAEALAEELRGQINTKRRTVGEALDAYKKDMEARGLRETSTKKIDRELRRLLGEVVDSPLSAVTPRRAESLYGAVTASGCAPATHHFALKMAKTFGEWCAHRRRRWIKENPFAAVEKIGEPADHRSESLRVDEARQLRDKALELADGGDIGAVVALVVLTCSLRPSEIIQIAVRDVDDSGAVLWVAGDTLKTRNTRRPLEVADERLRALLVRSAAGKAPTDRMFPFESHYVARTCKRIAEAADVPSVNARELRRTFATLAARRGRSLDDLAFSMGHGADGRARVARQHYIAPGAREAGAAGRVLGVLDGGKGAKHHGK